MNHLIKKWRLEAGMTQKELAKKLYLSHQAISLIEKGKRAIQFDFLEEVAEIFDKKIVFYVEDEPLFLEVTHDIMDSKLKNKICNSEYSLIKIDEEDIEKIISYGKTYYSESHGINIKEVTEKAIRRFHNHQHNLKKAKALLLYLEGGKDFTYEYLEISSDLVHTYMDSETLMMIAVSVNNQMNNSFEVKLMASGL